MELSNWNVQAIPTTFLVDKNGKVLYKSGAKNLGMTQNLLHFSILFLKNSLLFDVRL